MSNINNMIPIPGRLHSVAVGEPVSGANEVLDDALNMEQSEINQLTVGTKNASTGTTGAYPYNGMGRVVLPKNMVNGVNTLTQDMLYKGDPGSRVPNTNTIFVIQYDFDLGESFDDISLPLNNNTTIRNYMYYYETITVRRGEVLRVNATSGCIILESTTAISDKDYFMADADTTVYIGSQTSGTHENAYSIGTPIAIPANCVLEFEGGSISNGFILGSNTKIFADLCPILRNTTILGSWDITNVHPEWVGAIGNGIADDSFAISESFATAIRCSVHNIKLSQSYKIANTVYINNYTYNSDDEYVINGGKLIIDTNLAFSTLYPSSHLFKYDNVAFLGTDNINSDAKLFDWHIIRQTFLGCTFDKVNYGVISGEGAHYQSIYFIACRVVHIPSIFFGANKTHSHSAMYDISFIQVLAEASRNGTFFDYNCAYNAANVRFISCCLEGLDTAIKGNCFNQLLIDGCYFEANNSYDILFYEGNEGSGSSWNESFDITVANCSFGIERTSYICAVYWNSRCRNGKAYGNTCTGFHLHYIGRPNENNIDLSGDYFSGFNTQTEQDKAWYTDVERTGRVYFGDPKVTKTGTIYKLFNVGEVAFSNNVNNDFAGWICTQRGNKDNAVWRKFGQLLPDNVVIPVDGDFNDYKDIGVYRTYSNTNDESYAYSMVNAPAQRSGILEVIKCNANNIIIQRFTSFTHDPEASGSIFLSWTRYCKPDGSFSNWLLDNTLQGYLYSTQLALYVSTYGTIQDGFTTFCRDLKKIAIKDGEKWYEASGVVIGTPTSGTFSNKPTVNDNNIPIGFEYFCTDKQTTEGAADGIVIIHKGSNVWVDALGRVVS